MILSRGGHGVDELDEENKTNKGRLRFNTLGLLLPELIRP